MHATYVMLSKNESLLNTYSYFVDVNLHVILHIESSHENPKKYSIILINKKDIFVNLYSNEILFLVFKVRVFIFLFVTENYYILWQIP